MAYSLLADQSTNGVLNLLVAQSVAMIVWFGVQVVRMRRIKKRARCERGLVVKIIEDDDDDPDPDLVTIEYWALDQRLRVERDDFRTTPKLGDWLPLYYFPGRPNKVWLDRDLDEPMIVFVVSIALLIGCLVIKWFW